MTIQMIMLSLSYSKNSKQIHEINNQLFPKENHVVEFQLIYRLLCFVILNFSGARHIIDVSNDSSQSPAYKENN